MVVSEDDEDDDDVDRLCLSSLGSTGGKAVSSVSILDTGWGDSAFNFFPLIGFDFLGDVSKLNKGIASGLERVVRRVQGPRATSSIVSSRVLFPSFS